MKKMEGLGYQPLPGGPGGRDRSPLDRPQPRRYISPLAAIEPQRSSELRPRQGAARQKASVRPVAPGQVGGGGG